MKETKLITNEELIQAYKDKINLLEELIKVKDQRIEYLHEHIDSLNSLIDKIIKR